MFIQAIFLVLSLLLTFLFFLYGFNHYYLLNAARQYQPPRLPPDASQSRPSVSIHLPIYNEKYVVRRLVTACIHMAEEYGADQVEILILDDSTDDTVGVIDELVKECAEGDSDQPYQIKVMRRAKRQGFKAGALQMALEYTKAEFIAIFDADFSPPADFLVRLMPYFGLNEQLGIIQTRWSHLNRFYNLITKAIAIGIDVHFIVEQTGRYAGGCFQNFNGSGGVLRKKALVEAGGWQSDTLAEDLDVSYRIQLYGYHILYLRDILCPGEIPPTLPSFKKQQARWANGSLRTAKKILPNLLTNQALSLKLRLEGFIHLTGYIIHPLMFISFLLACLATILRVDSFLIHSHMLTPFGGSFSAVEPATAAIVHNLTWGLLDSLILLCMVAAWISPVVTLKLQGFLLKNNLASLLILFLLGGGISLSNTIEAGKALLTNRSWEFKRTPKYATLQDQKGWQGMRYQVPLDFVILLELAAVGLGLVAISDAVFHSNFAVLLILIPYTTAYAFVSVLTMRQSR